MRERESSYFRYPQSAQRTREASLFYSLKMALPLSPAIDRHSRWSQWHEWIRKEVPLSPAPPPLSLCDWQGWQVALKITASCASESVPGQLLGYAPVAVCRPWYTPSHLWDCGQKSFNLTSRFMRWIYLSGAWASSACGFHIQRFASRHVKLSKTITYIFNRSVMQCWNDQCKSTLWWSVCHANIHWFHLPKCEDLLLLWGLYCYHLNTFQTKQ